VLGAERPGNWETGGSGPGIRKDAMVHTLRHSFATTNELGGAKILVKGALDQ
jgi:hypothetical protein